MPIMTYCKNIFLNLIKVWIIISLITIPSLGLTIFYPDSMPRLDHIVSQHIRICTFFRWGILSAIYGVWPIFIRKFAKSKYWPRDQMEYWIKKRTEVMLWLIIFELIVNEKLFLVILDFWK